MRLQLWLPCSRIEVSQLRHGQAEHLDHSRGRGLPAADNLLRLVNAKGLTDRSTKLLDVVALTEELAERGLQPCYPGTVRADGARMI